MAKYLVSNTTLTVYMCVFELLCEITIPSNALWSNKGSGRVNFRNFNLKLFYNLLFSGHFKTCKDSSLNKMSKLAPTAMEVKEMLKMFLLLNRLTDFRNSKC